MKPTWGGFPARRTDRLLRAFTRRKIGRLFDRMVAALKNGLETRVISCIAEADKAALEVIDSKTFPLGGINLNLVRGA